MLNTATLDKDVIHNTVCPDCVTRAPDGTYAKNEAYKTDIPRKIREASPTTLSRNNVTRESKYPSYPATACRMSSADTDTCHVKILSNHPITSCHILLREIGVAKMVHSNH